MLVRAMAVLAAFFVFGKPAEASEKSPLRRVSCTVVRFYVAKYSEAAAEAWARGHGATEAEIETARHCLSGATLQAANLAK
jgi:hypothetical protein